MRLFWFAISNLSIPLGIRAGEFGYRLIYQYMEKIPIRLIDFGNQRDAEAHAAMVSHVEQMLALHKTLDAARTPQEKISLQRHITALDAQVDRLVYTLYGLTQDEIAVIESTAQPAADPAKTARADASGKRLYDLSPPAPLHSLPNPEQAWADSAHFYSAKEESPAESFSPK